MDNARRAQLYGCADEAMELIELDIREDEPGWDDKDWWERINEIAAREDGSVQAMVRMMSRIAAASTVAVSRTAGIPVEEVLRRSRLALLDDIEGKWS